MRNNCKEESRIKVFDKIAKFYFSQVKKKTYAIHIICTGTCMCRGGDGNL